MCVCFGCHLLRGASVGEQISSAAVGGTLTSVRSRDVARGTPEWRGGIGEMRGDGISSGARGSNGRSMEKVDATSSSSS